MTLPFKGDFPITWTYPEHKGNGGITAQYAGTDFGLPYGTPLYAVESGEVCYSTSGGEPYLLLYGATGAWFYVHVSGYAKTGYVREGELIGYSGRPVSIGSGNHLHLGLQRDGQYVDPMPFLYQSVIKIQENMEQHTYTVSSAAGDHNGLEYVANKLGVNFFDIAKWNAKTEPYPIFDGETLIYYKNIAPQVNSQEVKDLNDKIKEAEDKAKLAQIEAVKQKEEIKKQLEIEYAKKEELLKIELESSKSQVESHSSNVRKLEVELAQVNRAKRIQLSVSPHWTEEDKVVLKKVGQSLALQTFAYISAKIKSIPKAFRILFYMMSGSLLLSLSVSLTDFDYVVFASQYKGLIVPIIMFFGYFGNTLVSYITDLGEAFKEQGEEEVKDL